MKVFLLSAISSLYLLGSNIAYALDCEVTYKAKKMVVETHFFKKVEVPKYKSGKANGTGRTLGSCESNALRPIEKEGWKITYRKTIEI